MAPKPVLSHKDYDAYRDLPEPVKTLTINKRPFSIAVINGVAHIDGVPTKKFIARCKRKGDTVALQHLLAVAKQLVK